MVDMTLFANSFENQGMLEYARPFGIVFPKGADTDKVKPIHRLQAGNQSAITRL